MTHFRLTIGAALLTIAAGVHANPSHAAHTAGPANPNQAGASARPQLATLAPESSTALIMLVGVGLTVVTPRNRRSVRSVPA